MGTPGNRFVVIEGACLNILKHYSTLARDALDSPGANTVVVPAECKKAIQWAYRYMLSNESDTKFPEPEKLENLSYKCLVYLYKTCEVLGYASLS